MKLRHNHTVISPKATQTFKSKVTALCYTRDSKFLGVATSDRLISIYDEQGNRLDKFNTKPKNKGPKNYLLRSIQFGPDVKNPKLIVGQTDGAVFVYKWTNSNNNENNNNNNDDDDDDDDDDDIGNDNIWRGKKSICNKFLEASPIVSVAWHDGNPSQCVYVLMEGKIKIGHLNSNQSQLLYSIDSCTVSFAVSTSGSELLSGHIDGSIFKFRFQTKTTKASCSKIIQHSHPPYLLSWGKSICVADHCKNLTFYSNDGNEEQIFESAEELDEANGQRLSHTVASFSSTGESVAVGGFDSFSIFTWNSVQECWEQSLTQSVLNMCSVTALTWNSNGSCVALGSSTGLLDTYNAAYRHYIIQNKYEITHVSSSEVLVRKKAPNATPVILISQYGIIDKVDIYSEVNSQELRYLIARTKDSLILCDMQALKNAEPFEIEWHGDSDEKGKFIFDAPEACIISHSGELTVVEYKNGKILGCIRTEYHSSHLISLRINDSSGGTSEKTICKKIAYLLDKQTFCIRDLQSTNSFSINHDVPIDFLELSSRGNHVIFRDKKSNLCIFDCQLKKKTHLLKWCGYAQWVPSSETIVAQSREMMHIYYNVNEPGQVSIRKIDGEIVDITRHSEYGTNNAKSEVVVEYNSTVSTYSLSEQFLQFSDFLQQKKFGKCIRTLEVLGDSFEAQTMWSQLLHASLKSQDVFIAERCSAALKNSSLAKFLRNISSSQSNDRRSAHAKLYALKRDVQGAERLYLSNNAPEKAILMYEDLDMYSDAIRLRSKISDPTLCDKKYEYVQKMIERKCEGKAAEMLAMMGEEDDIKQAIMLYTNAKIPEKAAKLCFLKNISQPREVLKDCAVQLEAEGLFQLSGELYSHLKCCPEAVNVFTKGGFHQLAREVADQSSLDRKELIRSRKTNRDHRKGQGKAVVELVVAEEKVDNSPARSDKKFASIDDITPQLYKDTVLKQNMKSMSPSRSDGFVQLKKLLCEPTDIEKNVREVIDTLQREKLVPDILCHWEFYLNLAHMSMAFHHSDIEDRVTNYPKMLESLVAIIRDAFDKERNFSDQDVDEVEGIRSVMKSVVLAIHYTRNMILCGKHGLDDLACKCAITLLRFTVIELQNGEEYNLIQQDQAFFNAGMKSKEAGFQSLAFLFLNQYIDYVEAIDENDPSFLSNEYFEDTAIPFSANIAGLKHYVGSKEKREEIRDWVLGVCLDSTVIIPKKPSSIQGNITEGIFTFDAPQCMITGYPIESGEAIRQNGQTASKKDYEKFNAKIGNIPACTSLSK